MTDVLDRGTYVPLLERRPSYVYRFGWLSRVERAGRFCRGWNSRALTDAQEHHPFSTSYDARLRRRLIRESVF